MTLAIIFESVGAGEWLVLLAVVLIVVGPKNIPATARNIGKWSNKFRRAAESFKRQIMEMDAELTRVVQDAENQATKTINEIKNEYSDTFDDTGIDDSQYTPVPEENEEESDDGNRPS